MPPQNIPLRNSRGFLVGAVIVVQCTEICLRTPALELPVLKKNPDLPISLLPTDCSSHGDLSHCCRHLVSYCLCQSLAVRGRNFGRGEAKAPAEQPNLLQPHERGERRTVRLQGYWGIAEREKAFETFLFARCICSCEKLGAC